MGHRWRKWQIGTLGLIVLAGAIVFLTLWTPPGAPTGPSNPSPDSRPACANKARHFGALRQWVKATFRSAPNSEQNGSAQDRPKPYEAELIRAGARPKHECFLEVAKRGEIDLLFLGDSITDYFTRPDRGRSVWLEYYGDMNAANFGIAGDRIEHLLWRLQNGELEGFSAKVIVLMIGTNNVRADGTDEILAGIEAVLREISSRQPDAKILLLSIFPRGGPESDVWKKVASINSGIAELADQERVYHLEIWDALLDDEGALLDGAWADSTHPDTKGYEIWASEMHFKLLELLGR